jgi:hypothetical protein
LPPLALIEFGKKSPTEEGLLDGSEVDPFQQFDEALYGKVTEAELLYVGGLRLMGSS